MPFDIQLFIGGADRTNASAYAKYRLAMVELSKQRKQELKEIFGSEILWPETNQRWWPRPPADQEVPAPSGVDAPTETTEEREESIGDELPRDSDLPSDGHQDSLPTLGEDALQAEETGACPEEASATVIQQWWLRLKDDAEARGFEPRSEYRRYRRWLVERERTRNNSQEDRGRGFGSLRGLTILLSLPVTTRPIGEDDPPAEEQDTCPEEASVVAVQLWWQRLRERWQLAAVIMMQRWWRALTEKWCARWKPQHPVFQTRREMVVDLIATALKICIEEVTKVESERLHARHQLHQRPQQVQARGYARLFERPQPMQQQEYRMLDGFAEFFERNEEESREARLMHRYQVWELQRLERWHLVENERALRESHAEFEQLGFERILAYGQRITEPIRDQLRRTIGLQEARACFQKRRIRDEEDAEWQRLWHSFRTADWANKNMGPAMRTRNELRLVDDPHVRSRGITMPSVALPDMSCQESAIRAAAFLIHHETIPNNVRTKMNLTQFVEYLEQIDLKIPVFVAQPRSNLPFRANRTIAYVFSQINQAPMNADRWAIVFFPEGSPHYSVIQLTCNDIHTKRCVIATKLPLCPEDGVFWRAIRTAQNSAQLDVMMKLGMACDCPITPFECIHEKRYGCPNRVCVGADCLGWSVGEVRANPLSTWMTVPQGKDVHVISPQGQIFEEQTCCNVPSSYNWWHTKTFDYEITTTRFALRVYDRQVRLNQACWPQAITCTLLLAFWGSMTRKVQKALEVSVVQPYVERVAQKVEDVSVDVHCYQAGQKTAQQAREMVREACKAVGQFFTRQRRESQFVRQLRSYLRGAWDELMRTRAEKLQRTVSHYMTQLAAGMLWQRRVLMTASFVGISVGLTFWSYRRCRWLFTPMPLDVKPLTYCRAEPHEIPHAIPDYHVFLNKMSTVKLPTEAVVLDALRRHNQMMGNKHPINSSVVKALVLRTAEMVGETVVENLPWICQTCGRKERLYQHECKDCKNARKLPVYSTPTYTLEAGTRHVGFVGIYAAPVILPDLPFRPGTKCRFRGVEVTSVAMANNIYARHQLMNVCYGRLCAFMIQGCHVSCYPRGIESGLMAFVGRMTPDLHNSFELSLIPLMMTVLNQIADMAGKDVGQLQKWTDQQVLDNQRDAKKREILRAAQEQIFLNGPLPISRLTRYDVFAKFEKHVAVEWVDGSWQRKKKQIPRLINSPDVQVNALLAPYTLPMLKWVGAIANVEANVFYAGGATPEELNVVLNRMIDNYDYYIEDDISMIDASHTTGSFQFHKEVRRRLWPDLPRETEQLFVALEKIVVKAKAGGVQGEVPVANASGVPMTSYNNSLPCMILRTLAMAYASEDCDIDDFSRIAFGAMMVLHKCMQCFAGDDGLVGFSPYGCRDPSDPQWLPRYSAFWAYAGFTVGAEKVKVHPRERQRLMTFLGMRPFWCGHRYEWGPEIARRLKTMFWQLDNAMQPFVWARGVAQSLLVVGKHVPVVREVCDAVLALAPGPTGDAIYWTNEYSTFRNYYTTGDITPRTIAEFCLDYGVTTAEYKHFRDMILEQRTVLVDLHHVVLRKVLELE